MVKELLHRLFKTDIKKQHLVEITADEFRQLGVTAIALDADNTSAFDRTTNPLPGAAEWIETMKAAGFKMVLLSNAKTSRSNELAKQYDIPVIGMALKPLPFGYIRTAIKFKTPLYKICMVGDQLFTDVLGANIVGMKSAYVFPHEKEKHNTVSFAIRRFFEKTIFWHQNRHPYET